MKEEKEIINKEKACDTVMDLAKNDSVYSFDLFCNENRDIVSKILSKIQKDNSPSMRSLKFSIREQVDIQEEEWVKVEKTYYIMFVSVTAELTKTDALMRIVSFLVEKINMINK